MADTLYRGSCLCGQVRFQFKSARRGILACHCRECRIISGHFVAAVHAVPDEDFTFLTKRGLKWYASSDFAKRGFCHNCGSHLFYRKDDADNISVMAGCLEDSGEMRLKTHIFCAEKGSYYDITDGEQHDKW